MGSIPIIRPNIMGQYTHKGQSAEQRAHLLAEQRERDAAFKRSLKAARAGRNHFARVLEELCASPEAPLTLTRPRDQLIQYGFKQLNVLSARKVFRDLLLHVLEEGCEALIEHPPYLHGLCHMAAKYKCLVRSPKGWSRPSRNMHKQFSSLLRHCFTHYPVPEFLDQAWCEPNARDARNWFTDIGNGRNIRESEGLPFVMTKRMAHQFLQAPGDLRVEEALRWAQVTGQFGDPRLARGIIPSRLGRMEFANEAYWSDAIRFFIRQPLMDPAKLSEVVDFLDDRLRAGAAIGLVGRTAASLVRLSDDWHRMAPRIAGTPIVREWIPCSIQGVGFTTGKEMDRVNWKVFELLTVHALTDEGRAMRHCVGSYAWSCVNRSTAIFSIAAEDAAGNIKRMATIEVSLKTMRVVQAKARQNDPIKSSVRAILERWSEREGLTISEHL